MEKLPMCRICLVQNVRMYLMVHKNFRELYEKLTDIPFVTEDRRPILACFFCCAKLKQCCQLLRKCLEAEELFTQMMNEYDEPNPLIYQGHLEFLGGYIKSPIENISIVDVVQTESIAIKEELPAVCERPDDIIEPTDEHQSDDLGAQVVVVAASSPFNLGSSKIGIIDKKLRKMEKLPMCRICLVQNVRMYLVINRNFRELYEKLTDIPFVTEDRRPLLVCFFCCAKLEKCSQLLRRCLEAEEMFAHMNEDYEPKPLINQDHLEYLGGFIKSQLENISIVDVVQTESIAIKEELPAVCEGTDDIIEPKEEHQSDEFKTDVEEEEEVPRKKRRTSETTQHHPTEPAKAVASTSGLPRSAVTEHSFAGPAQEADVEMEFSINDEEFDYSIPRLTDLCFSDDDDDLNIYNNACLISTVQERNGITEPACASDITEFQTIVLQREDAANDQALRDIVPKDCFSFNWSKDRRTFFGRREEFTNTTGPTFDVTDQTRPIDIFDKMFDTDFIDRLCTETNRNAEIALLRKQNKLTPNSRFNRWSPTDRDEMVSFLAIHVLQSLYPLPEEEAYFKFNGFGTMAYFGKLMSYNRFLLLKTFFHFASSQTLLDTTRLCKLRSLIVYFNNKFSSLYMPSQEIVIDELLLKWHGRLTFAQKISSKSAEIGVKTYELCESSSGYLWRFFVDAGKDNPTTSTDSTYRKNTQPHEQTNDGPDGDEAIDRLDYGGTIVASTGDSGDRPTNATTKIVYDLMEPLLHRGHTLILDNFDNCPLLLRWLKQKKTDCYGTLRLNREFLPESVKNLKKTELRHGEVVATYCSDLSVLIWRNANIVSMISTYHNFQTATHENYNRVTSEPSIVLDYNKSMRGVDRKNQFLSAHPMERQKNRFWYKNVFRRLYNVGIFNCFVIFSSFHRKISNRQFRIVVAEDLLKRHRQIDLTTESRTLNVRSNTSRQVTTTLVRHTDRGKVQVRPTVDHNHFPIRTGSKNTCCRMCTSKKTRTVWKCEECGVNLCINGCFKAFHKS